MSQDLIEWMEGFIDGLKASGRWFEMKKKERDLLLAEEKGHGEATIAMFKIIKKAA